MRKRLLLLSGIAAIGLLLRCLWFAFGPASDTPDTAVYLASAKSLFETGQMTTDLYMPLYPILIHFVGYQGVVAVQIVLSTATILLVYSVAHAVWRSPTAGMIAAALFAINPVIVYYANLRLTETLFIFLFVLGLAGLYHRRVVVGCVALVLANLVRPTLDMMLPLIVAAFVLVDVRDQLVSRTVKRLATFAVVYVLLMSPWWLHNYSRYHEFVRLSLGDGITMILENNDVFEQHGFDWTRNPPLERYSHIAGAVAVNDALKKDAIAYILEKPGVWLRTSFDRLGRFLAPWPGPAIPLVLKILCVAAALPYMLGALASLTVVRRYLWVMLPLLIPIGFVTMVHIATHATMRYRLPIDPLLMILASGPIAYLIVRSGLGNLVEMRVAGFCSRFIDLFGRSWRSLSAGGQKS